MPTLASNSNPEVNTQKIQIHFKVKERGTWKLSHSLLVDSSDPGEVKRVALKYMRKNINIYDKNERMLSLQTCFEDVVCDGTNTIYLIPASERDNAEHSGNTYSQPDSVNPTSNIESEPESGLEPVRKN